MDVFRVLNLIFNWKAERVIAPWKTAYLAALAHARIIISRAIIVYTYWMVIEISCAAVQHTFLVNVLCVQCMHICTLKCIACVQCNAFKCPMCTCRCSVQNPFVHRLNVWMCVCALCVCIHASVFRSSSVCVHHNLAKHSAPLSYFHVHILYSMPEIQ